MEVRRTKVSTALEKRIMIGMIISDKFLSGVIPMYRREYWNGSGAGTVAEWCIDYFRKYEKAPGKHIQYIYEEHVQGGRIDESQLEYIELLLTGLSDLYEQQDAEVFNSEYLLDQAEKWFKKRSLEILHKDIQQNLSQENVEEAENKLANYNPVQKGGKTWVDPFSPETLKKVFAVSEEPPLFRMKGVLDKIFNGQFMKGTFISIQAPEKRGKSWFLLELAMMAHRGKCNVALFEAGDMTEKQWVKRMYNYISRKPIGKKQISIEFPKFIPGTTRKYSVMMDTMLVDSISEKEAQEHIERWKRRGGKKELRTSFHINGTLTVGGIRKVLDEWKRESAGEENPGFIPDVIVIDYADIMAPEDSRKEFRHQQDDRWKALRGLSQKRDCCIITATQAAASSYGKHSVGLKDFSEDKRKYSHITACYTLNQAEYERPYNILRVGQTMVREGAGAKGKEVTILQCLDLGMVYVDSRWSYEVEVQRNKNEVA